MGVARPGARRGVAVLAAALTGRTRAAEVQPSPPSVGADVPVTYFGPAPSSVDKFLVGPLQLLTAGQVDLDEGTITLPLYEGQLRNGRKVWSILTDTDDAANAEALGLNFSSKLTYAALCGLTRHAVTELDGSLTFDGGAVDFSPERSVTPGTPSAFPPAAAQAGAVGDREYTPLVVVEDAGGHVYNAPMVAFDASADELSQFCDGNVDHGKVHDKVVRICPRDGRSRSRSPPASASRGPCPFNSLIALPFPRPPWSMARDSWPAPAWRCSAGGGRALLRLDHESRDMGGMDVLSQMRTFTRVVDAGSLSSAARALRLSLAAVSRQMSALEADLGATLLLRTTRRLTVTDAGRRYYAHCVRVLREVEDARASVARDRAVRGRLTVTAPVTYGLARVAPSMAGLLAKHPGLTIDLVLEDRLVDLVTEGVDVAIRAGAPPPDSASVVAHALATYARVLVASPAYIRERGVPRSPEALASHHALVHLPGDGRISTWSFVREGKEQVAEVRAALRTNALLALRGAALDGIGIALLPDWLVERDLAAGRLRALLRDYRTPPVMVSALYRTELRGSPRVLAFVDHLKGAREGRSVHACRRPPAGH